MIDVAADPALAPKVSVIVPCYNAAATIEDTLRSVLAQSMDALEIIVVDDGSRDGSPDLVRELMSIDRRIRLIEQTNAGPSTARNRGIEASRADLFAFIDSDDLWHVDHLQRHVLALAADPLLGLSFSPCEIIDHDGRQTGERTRAWLADIGLDDMLAGNPTSTCSSIVARREVFDDAGPMRADMSYAEDQEWLFRVVRTRWRVRGISAATVSYRSSQQGLSASTERMLAGWRRFIEHARGFEPAVVAAGQTQAEARMHIYFARRAIRTGQPGRVARRHFADAISCSPRTMVRAPAQLAALAGACIAPRLANRAISLLRNLRHA